MTYRSVPYEDPCSTRDMVSDCAEVGRTLHMPEAAAAARRGVTADAPTGSGTAASGGTVVVPRQLAQLAAGMHIHLD